MSLLACHQGTVPSAGDYVYAMGRDNHPDEAAS